MEIRPSYTAMLIASKHRPELVPLLTRYPEHLPNDSSNDDGGSETSNSLPQEVEGSMKMIDDNNLMEKEVVQEDPLSIDDTRGEEAGGKTLDDDAGANENDLQSLVEDSSDDDGYAADEEPDMPDKVLPMLKRSKGRWHSGRDRAENGWLSSRDVVTQDDAEARDDALEADGLSIIDSTLELAAAVAKGKEADRQKEEEYESHRKHPHDDSDEHLADDDGSELELVPTNQQWPPFSIRSVDDTMLQSGEFIAQAVRPG